MRGGEASGERVGERGRAAAGAVPARVGGGVRVGARPAVEISRRREGGRLPLPGRHVAAGTGRDGPGGWAGKQANGGAALSAEHKPKPCTGRPRGVGGFLWFSA